MAFIATSLGDDLRNHWAQGVRDRPVQCVKANWAQSAQVRWVLDVKAGWEVSRGCFVLAGSPGVQGNFLHSSRTDEARAARFVALSPVAGPGAAATGELSALLH
jgi:hypothetical protein